MKLYFREPKSNYFKAALQCLLSPIYVKIKKDG